MYMYNVHSSEYRIDSSLKKYFSTETNYDIYKFTQSCFAVCVRVRSAKSIFNLIFRTHL